MKKLSWSNALYSIKKLAGAAVKYSSSKILSSLHCMLLYFYSLLFHTLIHYDNKIGLKATRLLLILNHWQYCNVWILKWHSNFENSSYNLKFKIKFYKLKNSEKRKSWILILIRYFSTFKERFYVYIILT